MSAATWVAGHIAPYPVVMDTIANTKAISHHRGEATEAHSWTGEGAGGEDVVIDGCVGWVHVDVGQGLALGPGQVP